MSTGKSGWGVARALLIIAVMLGSSFYVGVSYGTTLNGTWSGDYFTEVYGNFTSGLRLPFLTAGRVPLVGSNGFLTDDADLTFVGGNTLETVNISAAAVSAGSLFGTGLTSPRIPIVGAGGLIEDDGDLTFVGGDTLTATNVSTSSLYVNVDGSVQNYTAWVQAEIVAGTSSNLSLDATPNSDHSGNGLYTSMTVGENVTIGQALYMKSDGKLWKSDANDTTTMPVVAIALGSITANAAGNVLKMGFIRDDSWSWTVGQLIFASGTAGGLTQNAPDTTGDQVQVLGYAVTSHVIYFNPSYVMVEIV